MLRDKERHVTRRHGTLLRSGQSMLPDEATLCATCWMHGVFAAQLTIGNTSFHKLFSVSRDPYNITRASGLRMLVDAGGGWRLLTVPSAFEMGLCDCRWIYRFAAAHGHRRSHRLRRAIRRCNGASRSKASLAASSSSAIWCWANANSTPAGRIELDVRKPNAFPFARIRHSLWGQHYPDAVYHLVTSTPDAIEAIGGDELLYADGQSGSQRRLTPRFARGRYDEFCFAVVGSMTDAERQPRRWRPNISPRAGRRNHACAGRAASGEESPATCASEGGGDGAPRSTRSSLGLRMMP